MKVIVVGGAQILDQKGFFNIGKRNHMAVRKIFWKNKVMIDHEDVGGTVNRTIRLDISTGDVHIKVSGKGEITV
jgi:chemotaxis protein CheD